MDAVSALTEKERTEQLSRQKEGEKKESGTANPKGREKTRRKNEVISSCSIPSSLSFPSWNP